ncbi:uncharacterized protein LOC123560775 [Mercenaria mercenaria]|uniref:uncharacterized protein LOC123560775 n=1 Tax=Mercenaria mercenaria TaxID=6596 RepID=UPI00234F8685|nr:uncharacterized protein LOC123560775 [Mercenaria mercenaria]
MKLKEMFHRRQGKPGRGMKALVLVVPLLAALTAIVSGLNFTLSKSRVIVGTTGKLFMICQVTETDVKVFYNIQIRRETNSGWQTIALIEAGTKVPELDKGFFNDKEFVVGGNLDAEKPFNTHLTLEMNIEKITYDDARVYGCELAYKSRISDSSRSSYRCATLMIDDNTQQNSRSDNGNSALTVGAILGVTNILTAVYAAYLTVVIIRSRTMSFDDRCLCHGRREPEHTATVAKQSLAFDQQTYSLNDDKDTYGLSK